MQKLQETFLKYTNTFLKKYMLSSNLEKLMVFQDQLSVES